MEDHHIVRLYWDRNHQAIQATAEKYGAYCMAIARNILSREEDAEECVNDAYLRAWNAIPPHRPQRLDAFLGKITRNLAFNRYQRDRAEKRGGGEIALVLDELADCLPDTGGVEQAVDRRELAAALNAFVAGLSPGSRRLFVRRYWYADPVKKIAADSGRSPAAVSKTLERTRKQLKGYLNERGFAL